MATRQRRPNIANAFQFDYHKAAQATACLLRREKNRQMNYHRLLKLLYIADRESFREGGRPIVGGRCLAATRGPMHAAMIDLMKGSDIQSPTWATMFRRQRYDLEMTSDPGSDELSRHELDVLNRVAAHYDEDDDYEIGEKMLAFAEMVGDRLAKESPRTIPIEEIIEAVGRGAELEAILRDAKEKTVFERVFGG